MPATFVYVGNAESQNISIFALAADGALTLVDTKAVPGPAAPGSTTPMAVSPDKKYLTVGLRNEPYSAATFAIDAKSGNLAYVGSGPLADAMAYIGTDRSGKFLLSASYGGGKIAVNPIGDNGVVGPAQQVIANQPNAHAVIADRANRHVLYSSLGSDTVGQLLFDAATGKLTPNDPPAVSVEPKAGPRHFRFSPDERFVYLLCELDASIYVFPYDAATGRLAKETQVANALPPGFAGKPWCADIHLTPDGKFLYASERTSSTLAAFRVDAKSGALAPIASYPTEQQPRGFAIDPRGRVLLAVGQVSNSLTSYAIDAERGTLRPLKQYPVGKNPNWIEIVTTS
ncbi:MAG TPA: beta-propeller fold lactonase family protein [Pseudolabrys sp.]|nr:beta-propeller fold lactonase family protein [Pseudolabrys sp.]